MVLILRNQRVEKTYWEFPGLIFKQILVVYWICIFANWKCVFANRSNSYSMEHTKFFNWLNVSKSIFIWNMFYIRVALVIQKVTAPKFLW
jgi:energy-coupling factor transporter transmembrane protein EcfT